MSQRKLLPRIEIRKLDERPGTYPSTLRTGDPTRKGNRSVYFDDMSTILYEPSYYSTASQSASVIISWPTTLPLSGNLRTDFTSSIVTIGRTVKASVGTFNNLPIFVEAPGPFKEEGMPEQIESTSDFFLTGSNVEDVGLGLSSKLKSKVIIRIKLAMSASMTFQASKASVYYYNTSTKTFEEIFAGNVSPATDNAQVSTTYPFMDAKMFGPFGNFLMSGSQQVPYYGVKAVSKIKTSLTDALQHLNFTASVLADDRYRPSSNNQIRMEDYIAHPFIVEKAVFEVPIEAGSSWFADRTQFMPNGPFDNIPDGGGPCVTFSLIGTNASGKRDLIMSATLIPSNDNISGTIDFVSSSNNYRAIYGFKSFGRASATISSQSNGTFSGSVVIPGTANVRNSIVSYGAPSNANRQWTAQTFRESYIGALDPYGRGSSTDPCGRSIYGKEYTTPQLNDINILSINRRIFGDAPTNVNYYPEVWSYDSNLPSPYVIFPKDNLVVGVSKHRPVIAVNASYVSQLAPTSSHDIKIATGSVYITLFGSLLRNGIESNDGHNPNTTSNIVHEIIGNDPIYDEYDVCYRDELRNSYITDYVSGSIFGNNNASRGKWRSSLDSNATVRLMHADRVSEQRKFIYHLVSFRRHAEANSSTERFFDSLVPPVDEFLRRGRYFTRMYAWNLFGAGSRQVIVVNFDSNQYSSLYLDHSSGDWSRSFPFEPRYARVTRATTQKFFARNFFSNSFFFFYWGRYIDLNDNIVIKVGTATNTIRVGMDQTSAGLRVGLKNEVAMKLIYGIGNFNNCYNAGSKTFGAVDRPEMIENVFSNGYAGAEIRGWKYGLINGLEQHSKAHYRRDKFGQYRDMLEQRLDTKYYFAIQDSDAPALRFFRRKNYSYAGTSVVNVKFVNSSGSLVRPEETYSSNLSFEATSSMPYFDGYVKNREEPLSYVKIQQFQYMS